MGWVEVEENKWSKQPGIDVELEAKYLKLFHTNQGEIFLILSLSSFTPNHLVTMQMPASDIVNFL